MKTNAFAFSNNDVIIIAWNFGEKPVGCIGFAVYRIDHLNVAKALPHKPVFEGTVDAGDRSSKRFPIQKFYWKDLFARVEKERTGNDTFTYKIVPMEGTPDNLKPKCAYPPLLTAPITISPDAGNNMKAYFNRRIISTQRVSNYLKKTNDASALRDIVGKYSERNESRDSLFHIITLITMILKICSRGNCKLPACNLPIQYYFTLVFLTFTTFSFAQTFNNDGTFKGAGTGNLYSSTTKIPPPNVTADAKTKEAILKKILERVDATIFNMQDDSLDLQASYDKIWGDGFAANYLHDLESLKKYLTGGSPDAYKLTFVPSVSDVNQILTKSLFTVAPDPKNSGLTVSARDLLQKDLLGDFLFERYKTTFNNDPIAVREMDYGYVKDWRQLESWFALARKAESRSIKFKDDIFSFSQREVDDLMNDLSWVKPGDLQLVTDIQKSKFIKSWLWYTSGLISINPLQTTDARKRYSFNERNAFMTIATRKLQDSIDKSNLLDEFKTTSKVYNKLLLPIPDAKDDDDYWLQEIDASENYLPNTRPAGLTLYRKKQLRLAVYNVPSSKKLSFSGSKEQLEYVSQAVTEVNKVADQIGILTSLGTSNAAVFAKVLGLLNSPALNPVQRNFQATTTGPLVGLNAKAFDSVREYASKQHLYMSTEKAKSSQEDSLLYEDLKEVTKPKLAIKIKDQWVPLTGKDLNEDKRRMIWVSALTTVLNKPDTNDPMFAKLVDEFVRENNYSFIDYNHLDQSYKLLIDSFNAFSDSVKKKFKAVEALNAKALNVYQNIFPYVRIYNRSLPPVLTSAKIDTVPLLRTFLSTQKVPDAPAKLSYVITEQSADGKGAAKEVVKESVKVIETQKVDFSVGLSYTTSEYNVTTDSQPLPTSKLGDQFKFIAGINVYPFGRLNMLDDKLPGKFSDRFSVYAGLSIAKALDNYYVGLSYDWFPGIKTIAGCHFYRNYRFTIINNTVADKSSGILPAGPFVSLNLQPLTIGKAIGLFK